ncbi:hypothetical protein EVAR_94295_1 [Eumeta japonica]|uniref:Uncharacterized protein n=1 Tax=Eumeta variegata TaxID=151549 RepID=A0A4C1UEX1_EUMVA|nr:hypothetical protein EVAR_94295_1 [Eumeta japonica]
MTNRLDTTSKSELSSDNSQAIGFVKGDKARKAASQTAAPELEKLRDKEHRRSKRLTAPTAKARLSATAKLQSAFVHFITRRHVFASDYPHPKALKGRNILH